MNSVERLVAAGFSEATASQYLKALHDTLHDHCLNHACHTVKHQHHHLLSTQHTTMDAIKAESEGAASATSASLATDHQALMASIQKCRQELQEHTSSFEQTTRLDINLERQRSGEATREMVVRVGEVVGKGEQMVGVVRESMTEEGKRVMWAMAAVFGVALALIIAA